jgi:hypothetical protein
MTGSGWWRIEKGGVSRRVKACRNLTKEQYATMSDSTVVPLCQPDRVDHPLRAVLRSGACGMLAQFED